MTHTLEQYRQLTTCPAERISHMQLPPLSLTEHSDHISALITGGLGGLIHF